MSGVFVSYARADQPLARQVRNGLASLGLIVVWDEAMPSEDWQEYLELSITELTAVIVLWTPASLKSDSVRDEARLALDKRKLINLLHGVDKPRFPYDRINGLSLQEWEAGKPHAGWQRLIESIGQRLAASGTMAAGQLVEMYHAQLHDGEERRAAIKIAGRGLSAAKRSCDQRNTVLAAMTADLAAAEQQIAALKQINASKAVLAAAQDECDTAAAKLAESNRELEQHRGEVEQHSEAVDGLKADLEQWLVQIGGVSAGIAAPIIKRVVPPVPTAPVTTQPDPPLAPKDSEPGSVTSPPPAPTSPPKNGGKIEHRPVSSEHSLLRIIFYLLAALLVLLAIMLLWGLIPAKTKLEPGAGEAARAAAAVASPPAAAPIVFKPQAWLQGEWVIDQAANGCNRKLAIRIDEARPGELVFTIAGKETRLPFRDVTPVNGNTAVETETLQYQSLDAERIVVKRVAEGRVIYELSRCKS